MEELHKNDTIDIKENDIYKRDKKLLELLLKDNSSGNYIIWATDNYQQKGIGYYFYDKIMPKSIIGKNGLVIRPRVKKSKREQSVRIKQKAEVFTPSWVCNAQNNLIDNVWFGEENVFNKQVNQVWIATTAKITFPQNKTWQDYVLENRLEVSCGEAPYLVSRYDTVTGKWLDINNRIGILDRKLRIVNENTTDKEEWLAWTKKAYQSTYGFEWQGDSLLIARENLLYTFIDYYKNRYNTEPTIESLKEIAKIIAWNIWQMDGLKFVIPNSCKPIQDPQISLFEVEEKQQCLGCLKNDNDKHIGIYCKIKDWKMNKIIKFIDLVRREK